MKDVVDCTLFALTFTNCKTELLIQVLVPAGRLVGQQNERRVPKSARLGAKGRPSRIERLQT